MAQKNGVPTRSEVGIFEFVLWGFFGFFFFFVFFWWVSQQIRILKRFPFTGL